MRPALERGELGEAGGIAREHAGEIHEFGEAEHLWDGRRAAADRRPRAARRRSRDAVAGTQLDSCTRRSIAVADRGVEEIAQARRAEHVGDLVRIADRRGDAMREHAAVEFERRDQRGFDMQMRVDEAGHDDLAARRRSRARRDSRRACRRCGRRRSRRRFRSVRRRRDRTPARPSARDRPARGRAPARWRGREKRDPSCGLRTARKRYNTRWMHAHSARESPGLRDAKEGANSRRGALSS